MRKNIFLRALYDFANSIVMIVFLFYFSQWLVVDRGMSEFDFNMLMVITSIVFIIIVPSISALIDKGVDKIRGLRISTVISIILFTLTASMAIRGPNTMHRTRATAGVYCAAMTIYLVCFLYYTPMLNDLATPDTYAQVSGRGSGANAIGWVVGLIAMIPVASGNIPGMSAGRTRPLLVATILFAILTSPVLLRYDQPTQKQESIKEKHTQHKSLIQSLKSLFTNRSIRFAFLGYFFYSDALQTFASNYPLFLEKVHHIDDMHKSIITALVLLCAGISSLATGKLFDKIGLKKSLLRILGLRCFIFPTAAWMHGLPAIVIMSCLAGCLYGPTRSVARALFGKLLPKHLTATGYGYFIICERFATLVGPLTRGAIVTLGGGGPTGYTNALISMSFLVVIGRWITRKI